MREVDPDEELRLRLLAEEREAHDGRDEAGREEQYRPGSFGCHELLDRTSMIRGMVDEHLLNHPSCLRNPEWFKLASTASEALATLYQQIGRDHLSSS